MSVSIDKEAADGSEDARGALATWLDDYTAGRCNRADMQASFLEICRGNPEAPWDALALLDQYQRRGRVDVALARSLKSDIAQLVFGVANQTEAASPEPAESLEAKASQAPADTTGSRWRKLAAQRDDEAAEHEPRFDPTQFRREADPLTRPPAMQPAPRSAEREITARSILRDRYELQTMLGRGGAGTVYKAMDRHRGHLHDAAQCVAVKVLKLNYQQHPDALAELEREFHQAQSLSHPNIVSMFDLDRDGDTYFLVMELLQGELLADVLRRLEHQPMRRDRALAIVGSIGAALAHAHRRGVVHGDLKPRNVMITASGELKVLDFGFARGRPLEPWVGDAASDGFAAPQTPAYASAERVNGQELLPSEDVYSLACIAYELLSGVHPFGGRSAPLARAHGREPQRIANLSHKQWNGLRKALKWSRAERQIDVMELIGALGCAEVPQQVSRPEELTVADSIDASPVRRGLAIAAGILLAVAVAVGIVLSERKLPQATSTAAEQPAASVPSESSLQPPPVENAAAEESIVEPEPQPTETVVDSVATPAEPIAKVESENPPAGKAKPAAPKSAPAAAGSAGTPAATVVNNGAGRGRQQIQFDKDTYVATESDGSVTLTVRRTGSTSDEALFRWSLQSNSAEAGNDYAAIGPNVERIPAGSRTAVLTIPLVSDAIAENTELFLVELSTVDGGPELGELARAAVILVDDD